MVACGRIACTGATGVPASSVIRTPPAGSQVYSSSTSARSGHACGLKTTSGRSSGSAGMSMRRLIVCTARLNAVAASEHACPYWSRLSSYAGAIEVAGEGVVELVEEHELPGLAELRPRVRRTAEHVGDRRPLLRALEQVLGAPVPALDAGVRRVAATAWWSSSPECTGCRPAGRRRRRTHAAS